jgi:hypothetical protein
VIGALVTLFYGLIAAIGAASAYAFIRGIKNN